MSQSTKTLGKYECVCAKIIKRRSVKLGFQTPSASAYFCSPKNSRSCREDFWEKNDQSCKTSVLQSGMVNCRVKEQLAVDVTSPVAPVPQNSFVWSDPMESAKSSPTTTHRVFKSNDCRQSRSATWKVAHTFMSSHNLLSITSSNSANFKTINPQS